MQSRFRRPKNGVSQESVLGPLLYNIYTYDLPSHVNKYANADDLAVLNTLNNWKSLEGVSSQDMMTTLSEYLQILRLKLSRSKTVTTAYHLDNREAERELAVCNNLLPFCTVPAYLGVKPDRFLASVITSMHCAKIKNTHRTVDATRRVRMGC